MIGKDEERISARLKKLSPASIKKLSELKGEIGKLAKKELWRRNDPLRKIVEAANSFKNTPAMKCHGCGFKGITIFRFA